MYLLTKLAVLSMFLLILSSSFSKDSSTYDNKADKESEVECGDLLSKYGEKPAQLDFVNCTLGTGQVIVEAEYSVGKENAEAVEHFLVETYGMGKLKFVCCGWESEKGRDGQFRNPKLLRINPNYSFSVAMFASAEKENKEGKPYVELERNKINYFTILVQLLEV